MRFLLMASLFAVAAAAYPQQLSALQPAATHFPWARANDNRIASGTLAGNELHVSLEAVQAIWHPDGNGGAGIAIQTFAEAGKSPQIPGPLIRVPLGTIVVARVHNAIGGSVLTMHGMVNRPTDADQPVRVPFGETKVIRFRAGAPGTFMYWGATKAKRIDSRFGADALLGGALIVDPPHASRNDRIFVINQWINVVDKQGNPDFDYELDVINGLAWPHTERLSYVQNSTVRWRIVNASIGFHPLHLHGFFYSVDSRGDGLADNLYVDPAQRDREVTELVEPGRTFSVTWHADRPGNWLFHCHFPYHTSAHVPISQMLAGKPQLTEDQYENNYVRHAGMGGLILGVTVQPLKRATAIAEPAIAQRLHLEIKPGTDDRRDAPSFRYAVAEAGDPPDSVSVGPPIVLTRGVSVGIDVTNSLNEPTAVHWHGIELADSYYDGVAMYSGTGVRVAPMIDPGQTFEARLTPPRAGTFIYHTHMNDIWQLRAGLVGPLIVLDQGTKFDPDSDHVFTITTTHALKDELKILVNGEFAPAAITCHVGVKQRLRFINMTTFWTNAIISLSAGNHTVLWSPLQRDGAYVASPKRIAQTAVDTISIGQTRDYTFVPAKIGDMQLQFWPDRTVPNIVTVPIHIVP